MVALGRSTITAEQAVHAVYPADAGPAPAPSAKDGPRRRAIVGLRGGEAVEMGACCSPLPGERIVGISEPDRGIVVHVIDCEALADYETGAARWEDLRWDPAAGETPRNAARIEVILANETRALGRICNLIGGFDANIEDLSMLQRRPDYYRMRFVISVRDIRHLDQILTAVGSESVVAGASRVRSARPRRAEAA